MLQDPNTGDEFLSYDGEVDSAGNELVLSDLLVQEQVQSSGSGFASTQPNLANVGTGSSNSIVSNSVPGGATSNLPWIGSNQHGSDSGSFGLMSY